MDARHQLKLLGKPTTYVDELVRLRRKFARGARLDTMQSEGLTLAGAGMRIGPLCRRIAKAVRRGEYRFGVVEAHTAIIEDKARALYRFGLTDVLVNGVVNRIACELTRPYLSPRVYSYIKGRSSWQALHDLAGYLRAHRKARPDPRDRGLYVIKRDVSAYAPSIPMVEESPLWRILDEAIIEGAGVPREHPFNTLVRESSRPVVAREGEEAARMDEGVPIGSPIQALLLNIYLTPLDRELHDVEGSFYARYGDDIVFAHPDFRVVQQASETIDSTLVELELDADNDKRDDLYFTGPGRPSTDHPEARPSTEFEYLGCRVYFGGQLGLKTDKLRRFLGDVSARLRAIRRIMDGASTEELAAAAVGVVNRALDPRDPLHQSYAPMLRFVVDDRRQLDQIDYMLALRIAEISTGRAGARAFRQLPYRELREVYGLRSLVVMRNRRPRRGAR